MSDRFYSRFNLFKENNGKSYLNFSEFDLMSDDDDNSFISSFNTQGGVAFSSYYIAILNQATSQGYTKPSQRVQILQNDLIDRLVKYGIWDKLDILYVFAQDGDEDFGTINWINPSGANSATLVNAPTFIINQGIMGNGTSSYIDTNFNPLTQGVQYKQNDASRYFFVSTISTTAGRFDGNSLANRNQMVRGLTNAQRINAGANTLAVAADFTIVANTKSIHRTSATDVVLYNGITGVSGVQTSATMDSLNQWILRAGTQYGAHTCGAYAMGASLISPLNDNFVGSWDIYKNAL
jgi:hypothetical protein